MFHAFEKMDIDGSQIVSRRRNARLDVNLIRRHGLNLSQTDHFEMPYKHCIPNAYHNNKTNHWYVTTDNSKASNDARIAAVMSVRAAKERFDVQLNHLNGWLGATATGDYGWV
jgi:hypothetical protein